MANGNRNQGGNRQNSGNSGGSQAVAEPDSGLAGIFGIDDDAVAEAREGAPVPKSLKPGELKALRKKRSNRSIPPGLGFYTFRVYVDKAPQKTAVVHEGDWDEFNRMPDESAAIREFVKKYKVDPFGLGLTSNYRFVVEYITKDDTPDPRPRAPYSDRASQQKVDRYQKMRGKPTLVGMTDSDGNAHSV